MKRLKLLFFLLINLTSLCVAAQTSINSGGHSIQNNSGSLSFTVGEIFFTSYSSTNGYAAHHGIQYPYEILPVSLIHQYQNSMEVKLYPNPFIDYLLIEVPFEFNKAGKLFLYDSFGNLVLSNVVNTPLIRLNTMHLVPGVYIAHIEIDNDKQIVKLIKK